MGPIELVATVHSFMLEIAPEMIRQAGNRYGPNFTADQIFKLAVTLTGKLAQFRRETFQAAGPIQEADPESYPKASDGSAGV